MTIKLYRRDGKNVVDYHEAFVHDGEVHLHWGKLGEPGLGSSRARNPKIEEEADLNKALEPARQSGFEEISLDDHAVVLVEYTIDGMGNAKDLDKIYRLFDVLQDVLGASGLGHCDGHSRGSGTMEAACFVVDVELTRQVVAAALKGTEFADYTRIFEEGT
jgi:hypothetical protein